MQEIAKNDARERSCASWERARAQRPRRARDGRAQAERQGLVRHRPQRLQRRDRLDPHPADDADDDQAVGQGAERERRGARRLPPERGEAAGEGDDARAPPAAVPRPPSCRSSSRKSSRCSTSLRRRRRPARRRRRRARASFPAGRTAWERRPARRSSRPPSRSTWASASALLFENVENDADDANDARLRAAPCASCARRLVRTRGRLCSCVRDGLCAALLRRAPHVVVKPASASSSAKPASSRSPAAASVPQLVVEINSQSSVGSVRHVGVATRRCGEGSAQPAARRRCSGEASSSCCCCRGAAILRGRLRRARRRRLARQLRVAVARPARRRLAHRGRACRAVSRTLLGAVVRTRNGERRTHTRRARLARAGSVL